MQIDLLQNTKLMLGADGFLTVSDGIVPQRFTVGNAWDAPSGFMQDCSAGVRLAFMTDADHLRLQMILGPCNFEFGRGEVDVLADGRLLATSEPASPWEDGQRFLLDMALPGTLSEITVYLPTYRKTILQSLDLRNAQIVRPLPPRKKILFVGDSIVQGYGPSPAFCWAAQYARNTGRDFLNLGIGGAVMPASLPKKLVQRNFDEIVLSFGCNDAHRLRPADDIRKSLNNILAGLRGLSSRITVASPVPDPSNDGYPERRKAWTDISAAIRETAGADSRVHYLDGSHLIPHDTGYFVDNVHPALKGATMLADAFTELYRKTSCRL